MIFLNNTGCNISSICRVLFFDLFAESPKIIFRSLCRKCIIGGKFESFALIKNSRVFGIGSGIVTGVWFD